MLFLYLALHGVFFWVSLRGAVQDSAASEQSGAKAWSKLLPISLAAANLSVSGSILGVIGGTAFYREWFLVAPLAFAVAMAVFYWLYHKRDHDTPPSVADLNKLFAGASGRPSQFARYYTTAWLIFFCLLIGWELYVASQLLTTAIFGSTAVGGSAQFLLALTTCLFVCTYTWLSGFGGVVRTDLWQLLMGGLILVLVGINWWDADTTTASAAPVISLKSGLALAFSLFVVNVFFQVPQPMNWHYARETKQAGGSVRNLLLIGAGVPIVIWVFLSFAALKFPGGSPYPALVEPKTWWAAVLLLIATTGFSSSTIDSQLSAACTMLRDMRAVYRSSDTDDLGDGTRRNPLIVVFGFSSLMLAFAMLRYVPDIFNSLLAISGCMAAFFPVLIASMKKDANNIFSETQGRLFFTLWLLSAFVQFALYYWFLKSDWAPAVTFATFLTSFAVAYIPRAK